MREHLRHALLALVALLLASSAVAQERPVFDTALPRGLPDVSGWESDGASLDLEEPARTLDYELRVEPGRRQGVWALTRYRTHFAEASSSGTDGAERLQWNDDGRLRRWVCRPLAGPRAAGDCEWRELPEASPEYQAELASILLIWRMHRRLLHARARSLLPHDD